MLLLPGGPVAAGAGGGSQSQAGQAGCRVSCEEPGTGTRAGVTCDHDIRDITLWHYPDHSVTADLSMRSSVTRGAVLVITVLGLASVAAAAFGEGNKFAMHSIQTWEPNRLCRNYIDIVLLTHMASSLTQWHCACTSALILGECNRKTD